jgi:hypothetical protein
MTAGTEDDMSGFLDAGRRHPGLAQSGSPADGSLAVVAGSTSTDIGAKVSTLAHGLKSKPTPTAAEVRVEFDSYSEELPHERTTARSYFAGRYRFLGL